jgi:hypothetical protein
LTEALSNQPIRDSVTFKVGIAQYRLGKVVSAWRMIVILIWRYSLYGRGIKIASLTSHFCISAKICQGSKMAASTEMLAAGKIFLIFVTFTTFSHVRSNDEQFHEELLIKTLPNGHIYTHFQFTTTWDIDIENESSCKFCLFCRSFCTKT